MPVKEEILHLIRTDREVREAVRREMLGEELLSVPARLDQLTAVVARLVEVTERHDRQIGELIAAQRRTEARLDALAGRVDALAVHVEALAAAQLRTEERLDRLIETVLRVEGQLDWLSQWQRGEQGRREGERYERNTVRSAGAIFGGGRPLDERPEAHARLRDAVSALYQTDDFDEQNDPFLADLIWLKGERFVVVEISYQVDRDDLERADRRAATLRMLGMPATGVVLGTAWCSEEAERAAFNHEVEWRVGSHSSKGYRELRRAPVEPA